MGMVDEDETDWKLIVINVDDANATAYDDVTDVPQVMRCCMQGKVDVGPGVKTPGFKTPLAQPQVRAG